MAMDDGRSERERRKHLAGILCVCALRFGLLPSFLVVVRSAALLFVGRAASLRFASEHS